MVNTPSDTHTSGQKMVQTKKKANLKQDVSPDALPSRVNIHGVCMRWPSSSSANLPKTSSSHQLVEGPTEGQHVASIFDNAMHNALSTKVLEVNPLAMVMWVENRVSYTSFEQPDYGMGNFFVKILPVLLLVSLLKFLLVTLTFLVLHLTI